MAGGGFVVPKNIVTNSVFFRMVAIVGGDDDTKSNDAKIRDACCENEIDAIFENERRHKISADDARKHTQTHANKTNTKSLR